MKSELKSDVKFFAVGLIGGIITLFLPVILWNVWFLDHVDSKGKLAAWICAPVFAALSAGIFAGTKVHKKLFGAHKGREGQEINPFWGWFAVALVVEIFIVAMSNT
jgi:putative flippase GtrA